MPLPLKRNVGVRDAPRVERCNDLLRLCGQHNFVI